MPRASALRLLAEETPLLSTAMLQKLRLQRKSARRLFLFIAGKYQVGPRWWWYMASSSTKYILLPGDSWARRRY